MKKSPVQKVRERFGTKEKLLEALLPLVASDRDGESREDFKKRLKAVPNKKLLHLHDVETKVRELHGNRDKLVNEVLRQRRPHSKKIDQDYRSALARLSNAKLLRMAVVGARAERRAAARKSARG